MGKLPIYQRIGNALANNTFDLITNTEEWPNINYVIADFLLKDESGYSRLQQLPALAKRVGQNLAWGIDYAENQLGTKIYRGYMNEGTGKLLAFITPNAKYRDAQERDYARIFKGTEAKYNKSLSDIEKRYPEDGVERFQLDFDEKVVKKQCAIGEK